MLLRPDCVWGHPCFGPFHFHCDVEGTRHTLPLVAMVSTQQCFNFSVDIFKADLQRCWPQSQWPAGGGERGHYPSQAAAKTGGGAGWVGNAAILSGSLVPHAAASVIKERCLERVGKDGHGSV